VSIVVERLVLDGGAGNFLVDGCGCAIDLPSTAPAHLASIMSLKETGQVDAETEGSEVPQDEAGKSQ